MEDGSSDPGNEARGRRWSAPLHFLAGAGLIAMMLITVVDIILRTRFNAPIAGVIDVIELLLIWVTFLGIALLFLEDGHITVDIVDTVVKPRVLTGIRVIAGIATIGVMGLIAWLSWRGLYDVWDFGDRTIDLGIPLTWYWAAILLGCGGSALACLIWLGGFLRRRRGAADGA